MLQKLFAVVACATLFALPSLSFAEFEAGNIELTLAGNAANGPDFDGFSAGASASIGYFVTKELELGLRQSINYTDVGVGSALNGSTRVAADYNFDLGQVVPFVGVNIGFVYGDAVNDTWEAAPEGGVKIFLNKTTFIMIMAEYQFFFDQGSNASQAFSDGQFIYTVGLGVKF